MTRLRIGEAGLHRAFEVALLLKAAHSVLEILAGAALLWMSTGTIAALAKRLTQSELLEDPNDIIAGFILRTAEGLSVGSKQAAAIFLLSHGAIKLVLVAAVLAGFAWAYPVFIAALGFLIIYQTYQLALGFSLGLSLLTLLDIVVLGLTVHEYRLRRTHGTGG